MLISVKEELASHRVKLILNMKKFGNCEWVILRWIKNSGYILATKTLRTKWIVRIINHKTHIKRTDNTLYKCSHECKRRVWIVGAELQSLYFQGFWGSFLLELHFDCIFLFNCSVIDCCMLIAGVIGNTGRCRSISENTS